jgi:hypothetical protein
VKVYPDTVATDLHRTQSVLVVALPDEVEALHAVGAAIGEGVTDLERLVFRQEADEMGRPSTFDTGDRRRRVGHV